MKTRKGLGLGKGSGYYNIIPQYDSYVHSLSAKGVKWYLKKPKFIETKGNEKITITCPECGTKFSNWSNIFEGKETSYICPKCRYEGYAYPKITKINAKGKNIIDRGEYFLVDDRYTIYKDDGVVYDMEEAKDIPQHIFKLRDKLINVNAKGKGRDRYKPTLDVDDIYSRGSFVRKFKDSFGEYEQIEEWQVGKHKYLIGRNYSEGESILLSAKGKNQLCANTLKRGDKISTSNFKEGIVQEVHPYGYDVRVFDGNRIVGEVVVFKEDKIKKLNAKGKKYIVTADGFAFEHSVTAKNQKEAVKIVNKVLRGELKKVQEIGGDIYVNNSVYEQEVK